MPINGIKRSCSSNEPFPSSGAIPKSRSKKSVHVSDLKAQKSLSKCSIPSWIIEILFVQTNQHMIIFCRSSKHYRSLFRIRLITCEDVFTAAYAFAIVLITELSVKLISCQMCRLAIRPVPLYKSAKM